MTDPPPIPVPPPSAAPEGSGLVDPISGATGHDAPGTPDNDSPRWLAFGLVCFAYLGVTMGEQVLSPVLPEVADSFHVSEARSGVAFGLLAASIAVANLVGGAFLGKLGPKVLMVTGLVFTTLGCVMAAAAPGFAVLTAAQILLGFGAGLYFPAGLQAVPILVGVKRRGMGMGYYGVAFSAGMLVAALLGLIGSQIGWRASFIGGAALAVAAVLATATVQLGPPSGSPVTFRFPRRAVIGVPTFIGGVLAVCQYGAIPFLTTFAVAEWGFSPANAAVLLIVGRALSIIAKLLSGAGMDRSGPIRSARITSFIIAGTGVAFVLLPESWPTYACAAIFAGWVSSLGPISNMVAIESFGKNGPALGTFRSTQIGIGALAGWLIGALGEVFDLRWTLLVAVLTPVLLILFLREPRRDIPVEPALA